MRVLHILDHSIPLHSGYAFRTQSILAEQHKLGWETFQVTSSKQGEVSASTETVDGVLFFRTAVTNGLLSKLPIVKHLDVIRGLKKNLGHIIKRVRPNILHAHSPALVGCAALLAANEQHLPLVYEMRATWEDAAVNHGTSREGDLRYRASRALETYVLKKANIITTICNGLRNDIISRGIQSTKIFVIPNAVDIEQFRINSAPRLELKKKLGLLDSKVLGFIGSFYDYEGLTLLLAALPHILNQFPNVKVLLVGGGYQEKELKEFCQHHNIVNHVVFTGRIPHNKVQCYYDVIDILVYPRLSMRLTELVTPLKPLEAMAQGRLLIASDVGGHKELIHDGINGVLFRAGHSEDLAIKVIELLSQKERWPLLKAQARQFVEKERSWPSVVANYRQAYSSVLNRPL